MFSDVKMKSAGNGSPLQNVTLSLMPNGWGGGGGGEARRGEDERWL